MAARREQETNRRAKKKPAPTAETAVPRFAQEIEDASFVSIFAFGIFPFASTEFSNAESLLPDLPSPMEADGAALWDKAVESLGRSAGILEELAESTGEAIARIQKETRALLNDLVASETNA